MYPFVDDYNFAERGYKILGYKLPVSSLLTLAKFHMRENPRRNSVILEKKRLVFLTKINGRDIRLYTVKYDKKAKKFLYSVNRRFKNDYPEYQFAEHVVFCIGLDRIIFHISCKDEIEQRLRGVPIKKLRVNSTPMDAPSKPQERPKMINFDELDDDATITKVHHAISNFREQIFADSVPFKPRG